MTVKQLIERLKMFDAEMKVVAGQEGWPVGDAVEENGVVYIEEDTSY